MWWLVTHTLPRGEGGEGRNGGSEGWGKREGKGGMEGVRVGERGREKGRV